MWAVARSLTKIVGYSLHRVAGCSWLLGTFSVHDHQSRFRVLSYLKLYLLIYLMVVVDGQRQSWGKQLRSWRSRRASACFPSSSSLPQSLMPWNPVLVDVWQQDLGGWCLEPITYDITCLTVPRQLRIQSRSIGKCSFAEKNANKSRESTPKNMNSNKCQPCHLHQSACTGS